MMSTPPVFAIVPTTQSYDWGKIGSDSKVAQLAASSKVSGFTLDDKKPYAEVMIFLLIMIYFLKHVLSYGWAPILLRRRTSNRTKLFQSTSQLTQS